MSNKRWDWLEGIRPQTPVEWAVTQMAKILLEELSSWPPEIAWTDAGAEGRYGDLFAADAPAPSNAAFDQAIMRAGWELARDHEALEHYQRNNLLEQACPSSYDRLASAFIETYLTEAFFELFERTDSRVKRRDALSCLDQLSTLLRRTRPLSTAD
jgi:hypothetical protein